MNTRQPKWHLEKKNIRFASEALTMTKAALVMTGDIAVGLYKAFHPHPYYHVFCRHRKNSFNSTLSRLKQAGYVQVSIRNNQKICTLTDKGKEKRTEALAHIKRAGVRKEKWDGKWRLVMYDLPIRFKKAREAFRWKLKDLGFFQFQKSAWIYPYPCEGEILFVADFFGVRKHIEILEVSKILEDKKLREHFYI